MRQWGVPVAMECSAAELAKALAAVGPLVKRNSPKPCLQSVLVQSANGSVAVTATNLDAYATRDVADATGNGDAFLLPYHQLSAVVGTLGDEPLTFAFDKSVTVMTAAHREFRFPSGSTFEFPDTPNVTDGTTLELDGSWLARAIQSVVFCVGDTSRYALGAVALVGGGNTLRVAATDGKRMGVVSTPHAATGTWLLSPQFAAMLAKLVDGRGMVTLRCNDSLCQCTVDGGELTGRLVEGRFPAIDKVIPETTHSAAIEPESWIPALRQVAAFTTEERHCVDFRFHDGWVSLVAASDAGVSEVELPSDYAGKPMTIQLDPALLLDVLRAHKDCESLTFGFTDAKKAVAISGLDCVYAIMPMTRG